MEQQNPNVKTMLRVTTNVETSTYDVFADQGSSVNEMAFAVMVTIRALLKSGNIKDANEFIDMVKHYYNDVQFKEVQRAD